MKYKQKNDCEQLYNKCLQQLIKQMVAYSEKTSRKNKKMREKNFIIHLVPSFLWGNSIVYGIFGKFKSMGKS